MESSSGGRTTRCAPLPLALFCSLLFAQSASERPLEVVVAKNPAPGLTAYAYRADDGSVYLMLINRTFSGQAEPLLVSLQLLKGVGASGAQRMDLVQKNHDVAARTDITLGGASIDTEGVWTGRWKVAETGPTQNPTIEVAPASAAIVHFAGAK